MSIQPLPQFEADLAEHLREQEDRQAYERLNAPSTIVVRFGYMRMVGEFPYSGSAKPGCGSKLVVKTHRGTELGEMLTSTCKNSGCAKSVTRKEMLEYIEHSGGRQYPFYENGRVLRIATVDDLNAQRQIEQRKNELRMLSKGMVEAHSLAMTIIEAEPILGNERVVIYFSAEARVDFRDLVAELAKAIGTKVELRQIGARDEARITADYERCGQYCCCKGFLKVLKPVSMKSAKVQKATLDPLKISGRCGRLMCCLRYEDETYEQLRKNLPHRKSRVGTPEGDGIVINTQILTQLALVKLDNGSEAAIAVEELSEPEFKVAPEQRPGRSGRSGRSGPNQRAESPSPKKPRSRGRARSDSRAGGGDPQRGSHDGADDGGELKNQRNTRTGSGSDVKDVGTDRPRKKRRRRRRGTGQGGASQPGPSQPGQGTSAKPAEPSKNKADSADRSEKDTGTDQKDPNTEQQPVAKKKRKRRRRRRPGGESGGGGGQGGGSGDAPSPGTP